MLVCQEENIVAQERAQLAPTLSFVKNALSQ